MEAWTFDIKRKANNTAYIPREFCIVMFVAFILPTTSSTPSASSYSSDEQLDSSVEDSLSDILDATVGD